MTPIPRDRDLSSLLSHLDEREREVVFECLQASVFGPFFVFWWTPQDEPGFTQPGIRYHSGRRRVTTREHLERRGHEDWSEFSAIFGLSHEQVTQLVRAWPHLDGLPEEVLADRGVEVAINNAMNNLLGYPHRCDDVWDQFISVPREELSRIFRKWRSGTSGVHARRK
jgi:hypothetical protein